MAQTQPAPPLNPWRRTVRTIVAVLPLVPFVVAELGVGSVPWVAAGLTVIAGVTRVLAMPVVEDWLQDNIPWLAAHPRP